MNGVYNVNLTITHVPFCAVLSPVLTIKCWVNSHSCHSPLGSVMNQNVKADKLLSFSYNIDWQFTHRWNVAAHWHRKMYCIVQSIFHVHAASCFSVFKPPFSLYPPLTRYFLKTFAQQVPFLPNKFAHLSSKVNSLRPFPQFRAGEEEDSLYKDDAPFPTDAYMFKDVVIHNRNV